MIQGRSKWAVAGRVHSSYTDSDAWTLHRAISLTTNKSSDSKFDSGSNNNVEMATNYPHEDAEKLGYEKSEETYKVWEQYWKTAIEHKTENILNATQDAEGKTNGASKNGDMNVGKSGKSNGVDENSKADRRWIFAMRHGERVDLTYGSWVPFCFDENGVYTRKDLNMPLTLAQREGGAESYAKDAPLTRVGQMQGYLVGEGLRAAGVSLRHVYASPSLRCVETAHNLLQGFRSDPSLKVRIEPGLFEYKMWHAAKGMGPFMTPMELHKAGYNVDLNYKPYAEMDVHAPETIEEFYKRNELVIQSAVKDTEAEGGNIIFVGHATTLDLMVTALKRLQQGKAQYPEYQLTKFLNRVPYCALAAMRDRPLELVSPPCPPSINSSSGRFDWKMLMDIANE
ncbi:unnamed protein product, partial [Brenthis ino]